MRVLLGLVWKLIGLCFRLVLIVASLAIAGAGVYHGYHGDYARATYEFVIVLMLNQRVDQMEEEE